VNTYIGCSGWYYKEWKEIFYPKKLFPRDYFYYYVRHFNSVEVNSSFYRFPTQKTVQGWYKQASKDFKYSIKANRYITHLKGFKDVRDSLKYLYSLSDILDEKMGCFLFQFPQNFTFTNERLDRILSQLNTDYKNALEFRHPSWWGPRVVQVLQSTNVMFCSVSGFKVPEELIADNQQAYIRFHGDSTYSASYTEEVIAEWVKNIKMSSLKELWAYFNNTRYGYAVQNALEFNQEIYK
jgi:uncharacterized protein YecE (DUF72 family)